VALNTAKEAVAEELETRGVGDRLGEDVGPVASSGRLKIIGHVRLESEVFGTIFTSRSNTSAMHNAAPLPGIPRLTPTPILSL
jgi:hypothetical protein